MIRVFVTDQDDISGIFDDPYRSVLSRDFDSDEKANAFISTIRKLDFNTIVWYMSSKNREA